MTSAATLTAWNMWDSNETGLGDALWPGGGSGGAALTVFFFIIIKEHSRYEEKKLKKKGSVGRSVVHFHPMPTANSNHFPIQ